MRLKYCIGPYMVWASSFKHLDYKWNWMYKRNTQIYMYMIFFHTNSNGCDVEFFADSFYDSLYWFLNWFRKTFSSIFRNPYYVIPAVIDSMWCFSVHHVDLYWVMYTLDALVTIGLKANGVLDPRMEIMETGNGQRVSVPIQSLFGSSIHYFKVRSSIVKQNSLKNIFQNLQT